MISRTVRGLDPSGSPVSGCRSLGTSADGVGAAGSRTKDLQRLDQLESLFESIRSAPLGVVDQLVREIRTAHGGLKRDLVAVGPWEGREGNLPLWKAQMCMSNLYIHSLRRIQLLLAQLLRVYTINPQTSTQPAAGNQLQRPVCAGRRRGCRVPGANVGGERVRLVLVRGRHFHDEHATTRRGRLCGAIRGCIRPRSRHQVWARRCIARCSGDPHVFTTDYRCVRGGLSGFLWSFCPEQAN